MLHSELVNNEEKFFKYINTKNMEIFTTSFMFTFFNYDSKNYSFYNGSGYFLSNLTLKKIYNEFKSHHRSVNKLQIIYKNEFKIIFVLDNENDEFFIVDNEKESTVTKSVQVLR